MEAATTLHDLEPVNKRLLPSRWLIDPFAGRVTFEGRARLPEGVAPPDHWPEWLNVEWEALGGGAYRYRGTYDASYGGGAGEHGIDEIHGRLAKLGVMACRCDRYGYETIDEPESDGWLAVGASSHLECEDGIPVALVHDGPRDADEEEAIARDLRSIFGDALDVGPWEAGDESCRAPVVKWCP